MSTDTKVGVVSICHGYPDDISGFIESVRALNRKPDRVVLVLFDEIDRTKLDLDGITIIDWSGDFIYSEMMNLAFEHCETDWVSWIGIDDRYRPHALDKLDTCVADVLALGFQYDTEQIWIPSNVTAKQILSLEENMIPCGSPVRRWLWEEIPFDKTTDPLMDWCFFVGTALSKATYDSTQNIDVDYDYVDHWAPTEKLARFTVSRYLIEKLNQRIDLTDRELQIRSNAIEAIYDSFSWRITRPIRRIAKLLKNLRNR